MAEVWFYHLERTTVERELPGLLQRGLDRGLRMAVVTGDAEKLKDLSSKIWGYDDMSFIVHGGADEPNPADQPIYLCTDDNAQNGADFRFYLEGTAPESLEALQRAIILFDGNREEAVQEARVLWKRLKPIAETIKYWKQNEEGRWQDQASG
jgi:DNA polymerase III subunit chi